MTLFSFLSSYQHIRESRLFGRNKSRLAASSLRFYVFVNLFVYSFFIAPYKPFSNAIILLRSITIGTRVYNNNSNTILCVCNVDRYIIYTKVRGKNAERLRCPRRRVTDIIPFARLIDPIRSVLSVIFPAQSFVCTSNYAILLLYVLYKCTRVYIYTHTPSSPPARAFVRGDKSRDGVPRISMATTRRRRACWQDEQPYVGNGNCHRRHCRPLPPPPPTPPRPCTSARLINHAQHSTY